MKIDLHLHTNYSDGRLDPRELLALCRERNYQTVSITDHDNIDAYLSVKDIADSYGLNLVPGLELSSSIDGTEVHILAYNYDDTHPSLLSLLDFINENRVDRARKIVQKLSALDVDIDIDTLLSETGKSGIIGRLHIARALISNNFCSTIKEAFDKYLHEKSPAFEQKVTLPAEKAIPMIHSAGGVSVLAHPHKLDNISVVLGIIKLGIQGLEAHCPKSSSYAVSLFEQLADEHNLLVTGGSDFHGEPEEVRDFGKFTLPSKHWESFNRFAYREDKETVERYP